MYQKPQIQGKTKRFIDQAEARNIRRFDSIQMYKYACEMHPFFPAMSGPILKQESVICSLCSREHQSQV
jgi:hypothetical protein